MILGHGYSAQDSFPSFEGFSFTRVNDQIVDPTEQWTYLCANN